MSAHATCLSCPFNLIVARNAVPGQLGDCGCCSAGEIVFSCTKSEFWDGFVLGKCLKRLDNIAALDRSFLQKMPGHRRCRKCGKSHAAPTGKKCPFFQADMNLDLQRAGDEFSMNESLTKQMEHLAHKLSALQRQVSDNSANTRNTGNVADVVEKAVSQRHVQSDIIEKETQDINGSRKTQDYEDVDRSTGSANKQPFMRGFSAEGAEFIEGLSRNTDTSGNTDFFGRDSSDCFDCDETFASKSVHRMLMTVKIAVECNLT